MKQAPQFLSFYHSSWHERDGWVKTVRTFASRVVLGNPQVASSTDKVFYHIFLTCKCFMVINIKHLQTMFYVLSRYHTSLPLSAKF